MQEASTPVAGTKIVGLSQVFTGYRRHRRHAASLLALAGVLTAALWLFASPPAAACSCEGMSASAIERADAAVVGSIVDMMSIPSEYDGQDRFVAQIQVSSDLKDNLADTIFLTSEKDDGGNCGVGWRTGSQIAAAIYEDGGVLRSDGCSEMSLGLADSWQPAQTIGGAATLLIGGEQPNRLVAYDQAGSAIAFAFEPGGVRSFSVCPGGQFAVELVNYYDRGSTLDVRSLATFEVTSSVDAVFDGEQLTQWDVRCDSADGTTATTNDYTVANGTFLPSDEPLAQAQFDPQVFWPEFRSDTAAPIVGEYWMSYAVELTEPVTIQNTGQRARVDQLGTGESFGLGPDDDDTSSTSEAAQSNESGDSGESDRGIGFEQTQTRVSTTTVLWVLGIAAVVTAIAVAALMRRRTDSNSE